MCILPTDAHEKPFPPHSCLWNYNYNYNCTSHDQQTLYTIIPSIYQSAVGSFYRNSFAWSLYLYKKFPCYRPGKAPPSTKIYPRQADRDLFDLLQKQSKRAVAQTSDNVAYAVIGLPTTTC